ncbi:MAG: D-lactate dehydrogenase [Candidatus Woesearchaeota archaeon]|jgi:D-lactate dehydrogenase
MATIAFFEIPNKEQAYVKKQLTKHTLLFFEETLQEKHLPKIKAIEALSVFIASNVPKTIISKLPKLKIISTRSTGFDHIDTEFAKKQNIQVCNVPFYGQNTVAEHTFGLMLSLSRNIHKSYQRSCKLDYNHEDLTGFDLKGKTLGVIGGGHIGMHVVRMAKAFGMRVLVYDVYHQQFLSEVLEFEYAELKTIFKESDIITLHAPYNKHTHHIIDKKAVNQMKKGVVLINTSRGGLVSNTAIAYGLEKGIIQKAGLDVLEHEEVLLSKQKAKLSTTQKKQLVVAGTICGDERVLFTPHNAFNSIEAKKRIIDTTLDNIQSCLKGKTTNTIYK